MFRNVLIVLFTVVACAVFAAPAEKVREPVFPVGVYLPWELVHQVVKKNGGDYKGKDFWPYTAKLFNELKNKYNCNIVWVVNINFDDAEKLLKIADKDGLKVAVTPPAIVGIRHFRGPKYITRAVRKAVEKLRKYPSLAAYVLIDEARTGEMPHMENIRKEFARLDPSRPAVIVTMPQHTQACAENTGSAIICPDVYGFGHRRDPNLPNRADLSRNYYRHIIGRTLGFAEKTGKVPWVMPQAFQSTWGPWYYDENMNVVCDKGAYCHWRMPTPGEIRWQCWSALSGGMKGIIFFRILALGNTRKAGEPDGCKPGDGFYYTLKAVRKGWPTISKPKVTNHPDALLYIDGSATPQIKTMAEFFKFVNRHASLLARLKVANVPSAQFEKPFYGSTMVDPKDGKKYLIAYNDSTEKTAASFIELLPDIASVTDVATGKTLPLADTPEGLKKAEFSLPPGGGKLLALTMRKSSFEFLLFDENYSTSLRTFTLKDAAVAISPSAYSTGWEYYVKSLSGGKNPAPNGYITYKVERIAGKKQQYAKLYLIYSAKASRINEAVVVETSADGKKFTWTAVDDENTFIKLPKHTREFRFRLKPGVRLYGFKLIAVYAGK